MTENEIQDLLIKALADIPEAVHVTSSPGGATITLRQSARPWHVIREAVDARVLELARQHIGAFEIAAAPELHMPPRDAAFASWEDPIFQAAVLTLERYRMVVAAWYQHGDDILYVFGEDSELMKQQLYAGGMTDIIIVPAPTLEHVPARAVSLFTPVTRLLVAQAQGDAEAVEAIQAQLDQLRAQFNYRPDPNKVPCRWCRHPVPAFGTNRKCESCGALLDTTTIPTKSAHLPLISIWVNPDKSLFVEFVHAPPVNGRWDLAKVWRYVVPAAQAEEFSSHPMGRAALPKTAEDTATPLTPFQNGQREIFEMRMTAHADHIAYEKAREAGAKLIAAGLPTPTVSRDSDGDDALSFAWDTRRCQMELELSFDARTASISITAPPISRSFSGALDECLKLAIAHWPDRR